MSTTQINFYTDIPLGQLRINVDPQQNTKALKLLSETPQTIARAYQKSIDNFAKKVINKVKEHINKGIPPKGEYWPPLSSRESHKDKRDHYVEKEANDYRFFYKTGQYFDLVGLHTEKVEYYRSTRVGSRQYVGLPNGVRKLPTLSHRSGLLTLQQVAKILENGTKVGPGSRGYVPKRPLWKPVYDEVGGRRSLINSLQTNLRNEFKKLM